VTGNNHTEYTDDWLTPDELALELWGEYPKHKFTANRDFLRLVFRKLKIGGDWIWPEALRTFRRVSEHHFMEMK
jgi:hypothetical protein